MKYGGMGVYLKISQISFSIDETDLTALLSLTNIEIKQNYAINKSVDFLHFFDTPDHLIKDLWEVEYLRSIELSTHAHMFSPSLKINIYQLRLFL